VVGCARERSWAAEQAGRKEEEEEGREVKERVFLQTHSNHEFKQEFEFKHPKTMHQHICNRELLYFIN
jgi:hypothetical protein